VVEWTSDLALIAVYTDLDALRNAVQAGRQCRDLSSARSSTDRGIGPRQDHHRGDLSASRLASVLEARRRFRRPRKWTFAAVYVARHLDEATADR
jgi:hypothetical protein